jgi:hypothetical protein
MDVDWTSSSSGAKRSRRERTGTKHQQLPLPFPLSSLHPSACCGTTFWVYLMSCVGLVMFAGLMSGLSLVDLEVLAKAGTPKDRLNAGGYISILLLFFSQLLTSSPAWLAQSSDMI